LPTGKRSGLIEAERILSKVEGIEFVYFSDKDVVRHRLVQMIIRAYEQQAQSKKAHTGPHANTSADT
jgi:phosphate starvation-inducible protein PhoH and related proteins